MNETEKKFCIFGTGGMGRETLVYYLEKSGWTLNDAIGRVVFLVDDEYFTSDECMGLPVRKLSEIDPGAYRILITLGDGNLRKKIVEKLPEKVEYASLVHPGASVSSWVDMGEGALVAAGSVITCNIKIGRHCQLNINTTVTHGCVLGDYVTTGPGANISGNVSLGDCVYVGTNASIRQGVKICSGVTIGMGSVVLHDIDDPGVYVGNPCRKLR